MSELFGMVKEIQKYSFDILLDVKRVCEENNIKFYLSEGTLLGAVRHNDFIPWDDDIDIMMFREDYNKFVEVAPEALDSKYGLQHWSTLDTYWSYQAKVRLKGDSKYHQYQASHLTEDIGPYIDIFPIDYLPKVFSDEQYKQAKRQRKYRKMLFYKTKYSNPRKRKNYKYKFMTYFVSREWIVKKMEDGAQRWNDDPKRTYAINYGSYYNLQKQTIPLIAYGEPQYIDFNGHKMPIPEKSDYILTSIYGDYMSMPPKRKRTPRHVWNYEEHAPFEDATYERMPFAAIRDVQHIELDMLKDFDKLCKKYGFTYYLGEDTMLGAIRHKGFIPWDNNVTVLMPRNDYDEFITKIPDDEDIKDKYEVQDSLTLKNYWSFAMKFRLLGESEYEQKHIKHLTENNGLFIDVFPLDSVADKNEVKKQSRKIKLLKSILTIRLEVRKTKGLKRKLIKLFSSIFSIEKIHNMMHEAFVKYNDDNNKYWVNYASRRSINKQTINKELYGVPRYIKFEDTELPVPEHAEKILKAVYGNYKKLPPAEERSVTIKM